MTANRVGFWNLDNLFAPGGASRSRALARGGDSQRSEWGDSSVVRSQGFGVGVDHRGEGRQCGSDILGVCEVENWFVLDRLTGDVNASLIARHYAVIHADSAADRRGIDTAIIYDANVFQVDQGAGVVASANRWPSRSEGADTSAGFRSTAGRAGCGSRGLLRLRRPAVRRVVPGRHPRRFRGIPDPYPHARPRTGEAARLRSWAC